MRQEKDLKGSRRESIDWKEPQKLDRHRLTRIEYDVAKMNVVSV